MRELCRVAGRVFISVPNRYFPVEHHTAIPLLHFWDKGFELACKWSVRRTGRTRGIRMSWPSLAALTPGGVPVIGHTGIRLGPFSSNLFLCIDAGSQR